MLELRHKGALYEFSYDFVPNDGTDEPVCKRIDGRREVDGEIRVTDVLINSKPGPVCGEAMNLMWRAAVIDYRDYLDHQWREWQQRQRPRPVEVSRPPKFTCSMRKSGPAEGSTNLAGERIAPSGGRLTQTGPAQSAAHGPARGPVSVNL